MVVPRQQNHQHAAQEEERTDEAQTCGGVDHKDLDVKDWPETRRGS